jgi:hypothetical protein
VVAHIDGARLESASSIVIVAYANSAVMKVIRLTTYCHAIKAALMMITTFSYCAELVIQAKGGEFLVRPGHP